MSGRLQVLLIEDNQADILLVREALRKHRLDFAIQEFADAEQALHHVETMGKAVPCPDLVLLDLNLPKGSGMDFLRAWRKTKRCSDTPVIIVTSSDSARDRAAAAELGVAGYFRKPSGLDAFLTLGGVIRDVLTERGFAPK